ncbi:MAG: hypothetical protein DBP00_03480 [gamma proteobacterium symbiont of Ctena orbiculata]|nr:MAG: hypothetical protein DBP00_03480 [gamma proteobacterium symbiont of Ctena orbiculata]
MRGDQRQGTQRILCQAWFFSYSTCKSIGQDRRNQVFFEKRKPNMPEIGGDNPLIPLTPVKPTKPPLRRDRPKPVEERKQRQQRKPKDNEDDGKPHIDEYA